MIYFNYLCQGGADSAPSIFQRVTKGVVPPFDIHATVTLWTTKTSGDAHAYVTLHGADAVIQAAMKADALLAEGDLVGAAAWRQVIVAIESLENTEPDRLH